MMSRRSFLITSALTMTALSASRVHGANDRIRLGMIGMGERGKGSAKWFSKVAGVEIAYVCDPDQAHLDEAKALYPSAKATQDLREVLDDPDIDAVVISTCNHWHALAGIWACQAGKDAYVEKPISHNIWEGRKLVEAARKYDRIVAGGTQQRSSGHQQEIKELLDSKVLGEIKYVRCNRYGVRESIGRKEAPVAPPDSVDYNLWLGPAQDIPLHREQLHYDWHWVWNTGNGEMGNWGVHILDDARNVVFRDKVKLPRRVVAGGGRLAWNDAGETPNTHFVYMDCGDIPVIMDVHNLPREKGRNAEDIYKRRRTDAFLIIECEGGYYAGGRGGGRAFDAEGKKIRQFSGDGGETHAANFIEALRTRNRKLLKSEIEQTHYSSSWCNLANVSYRLGQEYTREKAAQRVPDSEPWNEVLEDLHAHLAANEIDAATAGLKLGTMLEIDPDKETFTGEAATPEALNLLRREYRKGFEVPEKV